MGMYHSNAPAKNNKVKQATGTNAGASVTFAAITGKSIYLDKVTGYTDSATSTVEAKTALTGTLATTSGSAVVVGTSTLFLTELALGDVVKIGTTGELMTVSILTDDTHFTATATSGNNQSTIASHVLCGKTGAIANTDVNWQANGTVIGKVGKALIVSIMTSASASFIQASTFVL